jgi:hypothetical protein
MRLLNQLHKSAAGEKDIQRPWRLDETYLKVRGRYDCAATTIAGIELPHRIRTSAPALWNAILAA